MEVVRRAGSAEAVRLALEERQITARAAGFSDGRPASSIKAYWWEKDAVRKIDPANNQAVFEFAWTEDSTYEIMAFEIEILGAEALWPATKPRKSTGGKPGPKEYDVWPDLFKHLELVVASKGKKFASFAEAGREGVRWLALDLARRPQADPDTVRTKVRERRPDLVEELIDPE